jgi:SpoVK/Ycf46/Vps4 family AAA+-type ATPase
MYIPPPDEKAREMMLRYFSKDTPGHENVDFKKLAEISRFSSGSELENICKDVHLEIAREIVEHKRPRTKATTEHYEGFIHNKKPTVLSWTRKVGEALEEGRIQFSELDPKLINDIRLARSLDKVFMNKKRRK